MNARAVSPLLLLLVILILPSCQSITPDPVTPQPDSHPRGTSVAGCRMLGAWDLLFGPAMDTVEVTPIRSLSGNFDVTPMIPSPKLKVNYFNPETSIISVDVTLLNPFSIKGYDVRGIIYTNNGFLLMNPDAWTGLFDIPGGEDINPFRAFAKDQPYRLFDSQTERTETFDIYLPGGSTSVKFAITASFPGNCKEPYAFGEFNQDFLYDDHLSEAEIWFDVFDWQGDVDSVSLSCPGITNEPAVEFAQLDAGSWSATIVNNASAPAGDYMARITATSAAATLYTKVTVTVTDEKNTIGLIKNTPEAFPGYTLFAPMSSTSTYLIDNKGRLVHEWIDDYTPCHMAYLLEDGHLLRPSLTEQVPGALGNMLREYDWDGNLVWEYTIPYPQYTLHHDVRRLPNGNTIALVHEPKTKAEATAAGRKAALVSWLGLQADVVIEVSPENEIVWEWHAWDHLASELGGTASGEPVSTDISNPGLIDVNAVGMQIGKDWLHANSVDYNSALDQVMISAHDMNEIWVIDHSTANYSDPQSGIDAAAGPAGNILYRWGNPASYQAGNGGDRVFYGQHDAHWIEDDRPGAGNMLVFNNGVGKQPVPYSMIEEIAPPLNAYGGYDVPPTGEAFGPDSASWTYIGDPPSSFYAYYISGANRQANGNTLICSGPTGQFFEVNQSGETVWLYINPVNSNGPQHQGTTILSNNVFKCRRYAPDYPGLSGHDLTPGDPIELP